MDHIFHPKCFKYKLSVQRNYGGKDFRQFETIAIRQHFICSNEKNIRMQNYMSNKPVDQGELTMNFF